MMSGSARINIDGAARGNPGPAAYAFVITRDSQPPLEEAGRIGTATNNVAEYTALIRALERAAQLGLRELAICSDSELLVKQMNGVYRVKNPDLQVLYDEAKELCQQFHAVTISHVRREQNSRADYLCNLALDGRPLPAGPVPSTETTPAPDAEAAARQEILACLRQAAHEWAKGSPDHPSVEAVWEQLQTILRRREMLR